VIYNPSALVGALSGSSGSTTASGNASSKTIGVRRSRRGKNSPLAQATRARFGNNSRAYAALSSTQAQAWVALGMSQVTTGRLARSYLLTGMNSYQSINEYLQNTGQTPVSDPPAYTPQGPPSYLTINAVSAASGGPTLTIDTDQDPLPANTWMIVYGWSQTNRSRQSVRQNQRKLLLFFAPAAAGPYNILAYYQPLLGNLQKNRKIWLSVELVNQYGFASTPLVTGATVS
jgi:hypothetical protein